MEEELQQIKNSAIYLIMDAKNKKELEEVKLDFLGKSGRLTLIIKQFSKLPVDKRAEIGRLANEVKTAVEDAIETASLNFNRSKIEKIRKIDVTEPAIKPPLGHLHLVTQAIEEITSIFQRMGFERVRYPEVEYDYYAFEALNFPKNHPARDDWETFFIEQEPDDKYGPLILTPHTSNGQIREMKKNKLPIKMLNIAKTYRRQSDVSHVPMFHQFEVLCVGKNIAISDLIGTIDFFVKSYFGKERQIRTRPYHFQFTEPSLEVDISCGVCNGKGCKLCKSGWLELGGMGMVHPNVLKNCGIDPKIYSGFASGFGVERVLMMKDNMNIEDLRLIYSNKLSFLNQF